MWDAWPSWKAIVREEPARNAEDPKEDGRVLFKSVLGIWTHPHWP
jgi:hypothetical protein